VSVHSQLKPDPNFALTFGNEDEVKYRIVNKDTGEIYDLRYDFDKIIPVNNTKVAQQLPPAPHKSDFYSTALNHAHNSRPFVPSVSNCDGFQPSVSGGGFQPSISLRSTTPVNTIPSTYQPIRQSHSPTPIAISNQNGQLPNMQFPTTQNQSLSANGTALARDAKTTVRDPFSGLGNVK
jgi:hypothetical protein